MQESGAPWCAFGSCERLSLAWRTKTAWLLGSGVRRRGAGAEDYEEVLPGYDEAGVRWLDGYVQRQHENGDPANREGLVNTLGSYLGECVIRTFGGEWAQDDGSWCVRFNDRNAVFPFAKVRKQLESGSADSV